MTHMNFIYPLSYEDLSFYVYFIFKPPYIIWNEYFFLFSLILTGLPLDLVGWSFYFSIAINSYITWPISVSVLDFHLSICSICFIVCSQGSSMISLIEYYMSGDLLSQPQLEKSQMILEMSLILF